RLALLGNLWLRQSGDHFFHRRNLFLDDRDMGYCRVLIGQELDAARVRQVRNVNKTVQLHVRDIDVQVARNIARQTLDLNLTQHVLEDTALRLHADGNTDQLNRHRHAHRLIHRDSLQVDVQQLALDRLMLPVDDHRLYRARTLDIQVEDRVVTGVRVEN